MKLIWSDWRKEQRIIALVDRRYDHPTPDSHWEPHSLAARDQQMKSSDNLMASRPLLDNKAVGEAQKTLHNPAARMSIVQLPQVQWTKGDPRTQSSDVKCDIGNNCQDEEDVSW